MHAALDLSHSITDDICSNGQVIKCDKRRDGQTDTSNSIWTVFTDIELGPDLHWRLFLFFSF